MSDTHLADAENCQNDGISQRAVYGTKWSTDIRRAADSMRGKECMEKHL